MNRRRYLSTIGTSISLGVPLAFRQTSSLSIDITETNAPIGGGDLLEISASVTNEENTLRNFEIELFVEENKSTSDTVTVSPGETENIDFQHRAYPVTEDVEFTVRVGGEGTSDQQQIEVVGVERLGEEYVNPDADVMVQPETEVMFEVDDSILDDYGNTHWFLDGEHENQSSEPRYPQDEPLDGYEYWVNTFSDEGVYDIAAAVNNEDQNYTYRWAISVDSDGVEPPTVEEARPEAIGGDSTREYDVEIDVSSPNDDLDRVVWWQEDASFIDKVTDVSGSEDTASNVTVGGSAPTVWVITEHNLVIEANPWKVEEAPGDEEVDTDDDHEDNEEITGEIESLDDLEEQLQEENIQVEYLNGAEDYIWLDYITEASTEDDKIEEVAIIAVAYADLVSSGATYGSEMLHAIFMDNFGNDLGGFFILEEWAQEYAEEELSLEEYIELIVEETFGYE